MGAHGHGWVRMGAVGYIDVGEHAAKVRRGTGGVNVSKCVSCNIAQLPKHTYTQATSTQTRPEVHGRPRMVGIGSVNQFGMKGHVKKA